MQRVDLPDGGSRLMAGGLCGNQVESPAECQFLPVFNERWAEFEGLPRSGVHQICAELFGLFVLSVDAQGKVAVLVNDQHVPRGLRGAKRLAVSNDGAVPMGAVVVAVDSQHADDPQSG